MAQTQQLTAQQRAALFGANTRQHYQMLGMQEVTGDAQNVSFRIPKARILQGIKILVEAVLETKTGDSIPFMTYSSDYMKPYRILRSIRVDYNNGFAPIVASAEQLALMNMLRPHTMINVPTNTGTGMSLCEYPEEISNGVEEVNRKITFMLDIPLTLNERDPVGLVLAQNMETNISLSIDTANGSDLGTGIGIKSIKITPMTVTFSIPNDARAFPDMSVLKIVDGREEVFTTGQAHIRLPVGMIYRKLMLKFENADGTPMRARDITSNIELVLNTADVPYSIKPEMLRMVNMSQTGFPLPEGVYAFDFSYQGFNNYGGSRDYIDTETLTEFTLRFTAAKSGKVSIISEKLSRLI